jgi:hypothetical protein
LDESLPYRTEAQLDAKLWNRRNAEIERARKLL